MARRACAYVLCSNRLPPGARRSQRFCSDSCRARQWEIDHADPEATQAFSAVHTPPPQAAHPGARPDTDYVIFARPYSARSWRKVGEARAHDRESALRQITLMMPTRKRETWRFMSIPASACQEFNAEGAKQKR